MSVAGMITSGMTHVVPTLEMKTSFLRPAIPGPLKGVGWVVKWGRTVCFPRASSTIPRAGCWPRPAPRHPDAVLEVQEVGARDAAVREPRPGFAAAAPSFRPPRLRAGRHGARSPTGRPWSWPATGTPIRRTDRSLRQRSPRRQPEPWPTWASTARRSASTRCVPSAIRPGAARPTVRPIHAGLREAAKQRPSRLPVLHHQPWRARGRGAGRRHPAARLLAAMIDDACPARPSIVVVISACFSGVFVPAAARRPHDPDGGAARPGLVRLQRGRQVSLFRRLLPVVRAGRQGLHRPGPRRCRPAWPARRSDTGAEPASEPQLWIGAALRRCCRSTPFPSASQTPGGAERERPRERRQERTHRPLIHGRRRPRSLLKLFFQPARSCS
jgi:hypothetical protein